MGKIDQIDRGKEIVKQYLSEKLPDFNIKDFDYKRNKKNPDILLLKGGILCAVEVKTLYFGDKYAKREEGFSMKVTIPRKTHKGKEKITKILGEASGQFYKNLDSSISSAKMQQISRIIFILVPGGSEHSKDEFERILFYKADIFSEGFFAARRDISGVFVLNYNTHKLWLFKNEASPYKIPQEIIKKIGL